MVTLSPPPPERFPFGSDNLKYIMILVRPFKFGMWVYMGNATNTIVLVSLSVMKSAYIALIIGPRGLGW